MVKTKKIVSFHILPMSGQAQQHFEHLARNGSAGELSRSTIKNDEKGYLYVWTCSKGYLRKFVMEQNGLAKKDQIRFAVYGVNPAGIAVNLRCMTWFYMEDEAEPETSKPVCKRRPQTQII